MTNTTKTKTQQREKERNEISQTSTKRTRKGLKTAKRHETQHENTAKKRIQFRQQS